MFRARGSNVARICASDRGLMGWNGYAGPGDCVSHAAVRRGIRWLRE